jgi:hypothetical protein
MGQVNFEHPVIKIGNDLPSRGGQAKLPESTFPILEMDRVLDLIFLSESIRKWKCPCGATG